jgi:hemolysin activation/secretion protein
MIVFFSIRGNFLKSVQKYLITFIILNFVIFHNLAAFELPDIDPDESSLSSISRLLLKKVIFEGNHIFSDAELNQVIKEYLNTNINPEQLQQLKNDVTKYYIDKGYINSGAVLPDQAVDQGIIRIKIVEGNLVEVQVSGNERLDSEYIKARVQANQALNLKDLQDGLQMLLEDPLLERINAELKPGTALGEAILKLEVEEARPYTLQFNFNNYRSPSIGAYRSEVQGWHRNLTGSGDSLYVRYGLTKGLKDYTVKYDFPLNYHGTTLSFRVDRSDSEVIEYPFNQLDIESDAKIYSIGLRHPIINKPRKSLELGLNFEQRNSKSFLLGRPFSFSPGVNFGESNISVIRFSQNWLSRSEKHVIAARSVFNFGIDAFGATINEDGSPDSKFFSWLGQFQYVKQLTTNSHIIFRTDAQISDQSLLPLEKFSVGGFASVRGYRENFLTRDNGVVSSLEWRISLKELMNINPQLLELVPFIDYGRAWNNNDNEQEQLKYIYSLGLGLRWHPNQYIRSQVFWGYALKDIPDQDNDNLQDKGIHFELSFVY